MIAKSTDVTVARKVYDDLRREADVRRANAALLRRVIEIVGVVKPADWQRLADKLMKLMPGVCPECADSGTVGDEPCARCRLGNALQIILQAGA